MTMGASGTTHGWVWQENVRPLLEMVAYLAAYRLDQSDLDAVAVGLVSSDADAEVWFEYPLGEDPQVKLSFAAAHDGDEVLIDAAFDERGERFSDRVGLLLTVFSCYRVTVDNA
jgi:hypothetical protein